MSAASSLLLRLSQFTKIPLVTPRLIELGSRGIVALPTLIFITHSIYYYTDFLQAQSREFYNSSYYEVYDFIVVGGGSAGAVVANRLSLHSNVLLLELGGDPHPLSYIPVSAGALQRCPSTDLMYQTIPQNNSCFGHINRVLFWPRGTGIGGSSNLNYMIYQRGNAKDYDNWANITKNKDWNYKNVLKYFKKLEDYHGAYPNPKYHGKGGPLHVEKSKQTYMEGYILEAATERNLPIHDTNGEQGEGFGEMDVTNFNGLRWGTYPAYIEPILQRKNLKIYRYSRVVKVHLDKHRHAYGVTYHRHGIKKFVRARREIILSAGAVDTAKLLLLSSIGPREHLHSVGLKCRVNLPVGQNLQDHVCTVVGPFIFHENVTESFHPIRDLTLDNLIKYTSNTTGPLASISTISSVGFINTRKNNKENWPDIQYLQLAIAIPKGIGNILNHVSNVDINMVENLMSNSYGKDANAIIQILVRPKSIGEIKLGSSNPWMKPLINPNYYSHPDDVKAMVQGMKFIVDLYENTTVYRKLGAELISTPLGPCSNLKFKSDEYYACFAKTITLTLYHPVGTCSMGRDDYYKLKYQNISVEGPSPVVDSKLRVFKTSGLRVIDASIMPVIINSNTNVPSIMIGEIGSDFIREYWTEQSLICVNTNPYRNYLKKFKNYKQCNYNRIY